MGYVDDRIPEKRRNSGSFSQDQQKFKNKISRTWVSFGTAWKIKLTNYGHAKKNKNFMLKS